MSKGLSAPRIGEWVRWFNASSKTDPTYKPKALLAVLETDGLACLLAVLKELKMSRTEQLIEAMREHRTETRAPANADSLSEPGPGD